MNRRSPLFHDLRAERLRARHLIGARRTLTPSAESMRRARLAYKRLLVEPDYRRSLRRRLGERCTTLGAPLWAAIAVAIAGIGFIGALYGPYIALLGLAALGCGSRLLFATKDRRGTMPDKEEVDIAREFDAFYASRAPRLSAQLRDRLQRLGEDLSTLLADLPEFERSSALSTDDIRFVRIVVCEHLVNAVDPYLALRQPGAVHETLMSGQIERIHREVRALLAKLEASRAQRLARSATFLERKLGP